MVARVDTRGDAPRRSDGRRWVAALFLAWRRLLTALLRVVRRALTPFEGGAGRAVSASRSVAALVTAPAASRSPGARRLLSISGVAALAIGTVLSVVLARPTLLDAAVSAAWVPLLAVLRLVVMRLSAPRLPAAIVREAWATGLLAQVIGVTDPLRIMALALWAWIAWSALAATADEAEARRAVAWATGMEAAFWLLRWAGGGVLLYLVTRG